jgi:nucleotide-binding universal stress UspA family protein
MIMGSRPGHPPSRAAQTKSKAEVDVMFERILLSVDGSEHAKRAGEITADLAALVGASVTVAHVQDMPKAWAIDFDPTVAWSDSEIVDDVVRELKDRGIDAIGEVRLPRTSVAREIIDLAGEIDASLIVMGTRGLSDGEALFLGSVSHKVAHLARCPVMFVR